VCQLQKNAYRFTVAAISQCSCRNVTSLIAAEYVTQLSSEMSWWKKATGWRPYRHGIF